MCRDPGDTIGKVSCCVENSLCFKNSDFDTSVKVPQHSTENELPENEGQLIFKNSILKVPLSS